ncbi:hypothetical protein BS47DRAFT_1308301 [Hydnum rufescens UP504]|uniref:Endosomal/vacuolar adapter protein YPT35 n=1 Tax=Hydnum rufescens UP504 TaxID=1448309 RepID=A0A9P6AEC7_9AGAM|nr:hypothetical protein BS47DRAFT_1308301 [Hydnum rufescens UP504]
MAIREVPAVQVDSSRLLRLDYDLEVVRSHKSFQVAGSRRKSSRSRAESSRGNTTVRRARSLPDFAQDDQRSLFSNDIWLGDHSGLGKGFALEVSINGWIVVGDIRRGAYIVYDCVIKTKDGAVIHARKRYSAFEQLHSSLMLSLPRTVASHVPSLPPKAALGEYRPTFLERRRRHLEQWLMFVLLHPDIGGCAPVREWVME